MKKILGLVTLLSLVLAGCSFQNQPRASKVPTELIQKNKKIWNKKLKRVQMVEFPGEKIFSVPSGYKKTCHGHVLRMAAN